MKTPRKPRRSWNGYIDTKLAREAYRRGLKTRSRSMSRDDMWEVHTTEDEFTSLITWQRKTNGAAP